MRETLKVIGTAVAFFVILAAYAVAIPLVGGN